MSRLGPKFPSPKRVTDVLLQLAQDGQAPTALIQAHEMTEEASRGLAAMMRQVGLALAEDDDFVRSFETGTGAIHLEPIIFSLLRAAYAATMADMRLSRTKVPAEILRALRSAVDDPNPIYEGTKMERNLLRVGTGIDHAIHQVEALAESFDWDAYWKENREAYDIASEDYKKNHEQQTGRGDGTGPEDREDPEVEQED